jgi:Family of unknown function (DUF5687)
MLLTLWSHQWKSFWRSSSAGRGLAIQIFVGFIVLYFLSVAIILGLHLKAIIEKFYPGKDVILIFSGFILYYFVIDFVFRFLLQDLPALTIKPYLIQQIRRRELIRFLNIRSLLNVFNLLPLVIFFPFIITVIGVRFGSFATAGFLMTLGFFTITNNYLVLYLKRKIEFNNWWLPGVIILIAAVGIADHFNLFSLSKLSTVVFSTLLTHPWVSFLPIFLAIVAYTNNYYFLLNNLYLEEMEGKQKIKKGSNFYFLDRYGLTGELISLEIKLIWRNKRPKTMILYTLIIFFYGFIFYKPVNLGNPTHWWSLLFGGLFVTGFATFNYGSYLFAWQSVFFDGLMSSNLSFRSYLKGKWFLLASMVSVLFLLTSFYALIDWRIIVIQLACCLYNIGVNVILLMYLATWNYRGLDISTGSMMYYKSSGIVQRVFTFLLILLPLMIYFGFYFLMGKWAGILSLGILGLVSMLMRDWWMEVIARGFEKRKYVILKGFRE